MLSVYLLLLYLSHQEEDFSTNKYGISMHENFPDSQCIKLIEDAENWMEKHGCKWVRQQGILVIAFINNISWLDYYRILFICRKIFFLVR